MKIIKYPQPEPVSIFSLPVEIRLDIYKLCFFVNVYEAPLPLSCSNTWLRRTRPDCWLRQLDLLLTNRQIYHEAKEIAYAAQHSQLSMYHQTYFLWQTRRRAKSKSPTWKWEVEKDLFWQPSCRNSAALAALRLPKVGLAVCAIHDDRVKEQLHALKLFCQELYNAFISQNVTESLEFYFQGMDKHKMVKVVEAMCPLWEMHKRCEVIFIIHDEVVVGVMEEHFRDEKIGAKVYCLLNAPREVRMRYPREFHWRGRGPWFLWDEKGKSRPIHQNLVAAVHWDRGLL